MQITNTYNLPQPLLSAIKFDDYDKVGDISVSTLIDSPQIRLLRNKHDKKIVVDASDRLWLLLGSAVHNILERADTTNHLSEERMIVEVEGWKLSGKPDLLSADGTLSDYKVTSVYSFLLGDKVEWKMQLNVYAWLYRQMGYDVNKLQIVAILRDHMKSKALQSADYPQIPFMLKDIELMPDGEIEKYIKERIAVHKFTENLEFIDDVGCTPDERWHKDDKWAVKKRGNKRAMRVFDTLEGTMDFRGEQLSKNYTVDIEHRPGADIRCEGNYCNVAEFCPQFNKNITKDK